MSHWISYKLEDGSDLLIEVSDEEGVVKAGLGGTIQKANQSFNEAMESARLSAIQMRKKFHNLQADEVLVEFGLKATGDLGNFAVGKVGAEANYKVTLKWKKESKVEKETKVE